MSFHQYEKSNELTFSVSYLDGAHHNHQRAVAAMPHLGAISLLVSSVKVDNFDMGDEIIYGVEDINHPGRPKDIYLNALRKNVETGTVVRVIRHHGEPTSKAARLPANPNFPTPSPRVTPSSATFSTPSTPTTTTPATGYAKPTATIPPANLYPSLGCRYDGLYKVVEEIDPLHFRLVRLLDQPPVDLTRPTGAEEMQHQQIKEGYPGSRASGWMSLEKAAELRSGVVETEEEVEERRGSQGAEVEEEAETVKESGGRRRKRVEKEPEYIELSD